MAGKERQPASSSAATPANTGTAPLNNSIVLNSTTTTTAGPTTTPGGMSSKAADGTTRDLVAEARSFTGSLASVFLLKKRDQQSKHLLEKAQVLIDALIAENQRMSARSGPSSTPRQTARSAGGMGQLWVKLDELKRENDDLRRQRGRSQDGSSSPKEMKVGRSDLTQRDEGREE